MNVKTIFIKDKLLSELTTALPETVAAVTAAGESIKANFPGLKWSTEFVLALCFSPWRVQIQRHITAKIMLKTAADIDIEIGDYETVFNSQYTKEQETGIKFVKWQAKQHLEPIKHLALCGQNLSTYLRTGALYVDSNGIAQIAKDAAERLEKYCSVTIESKEEAAFYEKAAKLQDAHKTMLSARATLVELTPARASKRSIADEEGNLAYARLSERIRLNTGESALWRALVVHMLVYRKNDTPRFYNEVTPFSFSLADVNRLTGYLPTPSAYMRARYPELYKDIPFTGKIEQSCGIKDDAEGLEYVRRRLSEINRKNAERKGYLAEKFPLAYGSIEFDE